MCTRNAYTLPVVINHGIHIMTATDNHLKAKFRNAFKTADSIEVDGAFCRHYDDSIRLTAGEPHEPVINLNLQMDDHCLEIEITKGDLDAIELCEEGNTWSVGGYEIQFYTVAVVSTNPVA